MSSLYVKHYVQTRDFFIPKGDCSTKMGIFGEAENPPFWCYINLECLYKKIPWFKYLELRFLISQDAHQLIFINGSLGSIHNP